MLTIIANISDTMCLTIATFRLNKKGFIETDSVTCTHSQTFASVTLFTVALIQWQANCLFYLLVIILWSVIPPNNSWLCYLPNFGEHTHTLFSIKLISPLNTYIAPQ